MRGVAGRELDREPGCDEAGVLEALLLATDVVEMAFNNASAVAWFITTVEELADECSEN